MKTPDHKPFETVPSIAGTCAALFVATAATAPAGSVSDQQINNALESSLLFESSVPSYRIDTTVADGIATLTGDVTTILAKERAIMAAKSVKGVRGVIDKLSVNIPDRDDAKVTADVRNALLLDPATDSYEVDVKVDSGEVTLSGKVDSWQEKQLVIHVTKGVRGVKGIVNEMIHAYDSDRPDSEVRAEVKRVFEIDPLLRSLFIDVEVKDNKLSLSGTVTSASAKDRAVSKAWVTGVSEVSAGDLTVDAWASSDMKKEKLPAIRSEDEIKKAVEDAFLYDPRVLSFNPEVSVDLGVVTLSGVVDNLKAKQAAEKDARNTVGVWRVKNHLKVRTPEPIDDTKVKQNLDSALAWNAITESFEIDTKVRDGTATLTGTVDSYLEKYEAADVAARTNGVSEVRDKLDVDFPDLTYYSYSYDPLWSATSYYGYNDTGVETWPTVSDAELIEEIEDEFFWSPFVGTEGINIVAKHGEVTLTGKVEDWSVYRAATENAYEGGAKRVINNLKIK